MAIVMMTKDPEAALIFKETMGRLHEMGDSQIGDLVCEADWIKYDLNPSITVKQAVALGTVEQKDFIRDAIVRAFRH